MKTATEIAALKSMSDRLRNVGCDRAPFTPDHAACVCRLANEAADQLEGAERAFRSLTEAIEREGYEVLVDVFAQTYSVRPRTA